MSIKTQIIELVADVEDQSLLEEIYSILNSMTSENDSSIWESLSLEQQSLVRKSYEQSNNPDQLVSYKDAKARLSKWL